MPSLRTRACLAAAGSSMGIMGIMGSMAACGAPASATDALPELQAALEPHGLEPEVARERAVPLAWQPPDGQCPHAYRIQSEHVPALETEPDTPSLIVLARGEADETAPRQAPVFTGHLLYEGVRAEKHGLRREWALSAQSAGPASPTAACTPKTWDPVEDFLALAYPSLPGRLTGVGERWTGARVEGRCNRSACVDPKTGGGGPDNHHRTCVTMSWNEQLVGVYTIDDEPYALVASTWNDGLGEEGIRTTRQVLVALRHGRPVWGRVVIDHPFPVGPTRDRRFAPLVRTWTFASIDACEGSLAQVGGTRPGDELAAQLAEAVRELQTDSRDRQAAAPSSSPAQE